MAQSAKSRAGRIGGFVRAARYGGMAATAPARREFLQRFLDGQSPDLPEKERRKRARSALRAHMSQLALRSANARRRRKQRQGDGRGKQASSR